MEPNIYTGVSHEFHPTKSRRRRNHSRANRPKATTRQFQRRPHHNEGHTVPYELHGQGRGCIFAVSKTLTTSRYKLSSPYWLLVTLLSKPPELQFVALRNAQLILEKRPEILQNDVKVFFCKYNDPIYVKLAKLEVIVKLANEINIPKVLEELKE